MTTEATNPSDANDVANTATSEGATTSLQVAPYTIFYINGDGVVIGSSRSSGVESDSFATTQVATNPISSDAKGPFSWRRSQKQGSNNYVIVDRSDIPVCVCADAQIAAATQRLLMDSYRRGHRITLSRIPELDSDSVSTTKGSEADTSGPMPLNPNVRTATTEPAFPGSTNTSAPVASTPVTPKVEAVEVKTDDPETEEISEDRAIVMIATKLSKIPTREVGEYFEKIVGRKVIKAECRKMTVVKEKSYNDNRFQNNYGRDYWRHSYNHHDWRTMGEDATDSSPLPRQHVGTPARYEMVNGNYQISPNGPWIKKENGTGYIWVGYGVGASGPPYQSQVRSGSSQAGEANAEKRDDVSSEPGSDGAGGNSPQGQTVPEHGQVTRGLGFGDDASGDDAGYGDWPLS